MRAACACVEARCYTLSLVGAASELMPSETSRKCLAEGDTGQPAPRGLLVILLLACHVIFLLSVVHMSLVGGGKGKDLCKWLCQHPGSPCHGALCGTSRNISSRRHMSRLCCVPRRYYERARDGDEQQTQPRLSAILTATSRMPAGHRERQSIGHRARRRARHGQGQGHGQGWRRRWGGGTRARWACALGLGFGVDDRDACL